MKASDIIIVLRVKFLYIIHKAITSIYRHVDRRIKKLCTSRYNKSHAIHKRFIYNKSHALLTVINDTTNLS